MKSVYFQNFISVLVAIVATIGVVLAHTGIVLLAILGSFVVGTIITRFVFKKWWNTPEVKSIYKYLITIGTAAVVSNVGWIALLI